MQFTVIYLDLISRGIPKKLPSNNNEMVYIARLDDFCLRHSLDLLGKGEPVTNGRIASYATVSTTQKTNKKSGKL